MLRIGICDDERVSAEALYLTLEPLLGEDEEIIYEFTNGVSAANWLERHPGEMELLFLDVEMKPVDGIKTAERIRTFDRDIFLVFVTGHEEFALSGYQVNAADYVIKPAKRERLAALLDRVRREQEARSGAAFAFKSPDGICQIPYSRIRYFYSEKRLVHVICGTEDIPFYGKLSDLEKTLPHRFVRIHNRYIVNADWVERINANKVIVGGVELPVSRSMKQEAAASLARLILEEGKGG